MCFGSDLNTCCIRQSTQGNRSFLRYNLIQDLVCGYLRLIEYDLNATLILRI